MDDFEKLLYHFEFINDEYIIDINKYKQLKYKNIINYPNYKSFIKDLKNKVKEHNMSLRYKIKYENPERGQMSIKVRTRNNALTSRGRAIFFSLVLYCIVPAL